MEHPCLNYCAVITKKEAIHVLLTERCLGQAEKSEKKQRKNGKLCIDSLLKVWFPEQKSQLHLGAF